MDLERDLLVKLTVDDPKLLAVAPATLTSWLRLATSPTVAAAGHSHFERRSRKNSSKQRN